MKYLSIKEISTINNVITINAALSPLRKQECTLK